MPKEKTTTNLLRTEIFDWVNTILYTYKTKFKFKKSLECFEYLRVSGLCDCFSPNYNKIENNRVSVISWIFPFWFIHTIKNTTRKIKKKRSTRQNLLPIFTPGHHWWSKQDFWKDVCRHIMKARIITLPTITRWMHYNCSLRPEFNTVEESYYRLKNY